jgi:GMP synthase PP-ATPase subunit
MLANRETISKSHKIIIELIKAIIEHIELPLEVAKIEGDAVFLFALKGKNEEDWEMLRKKIGEKLITFFDVFTQKIHELRSSVLCEGDVCIAIETLKLKVIVHTGHAELISIGTFKELSGIDVILVHRLLKNSVKEKEYILMTESACTEIMFPKIICVETGIEKYDDIGEVKTFIYYHDKKK